LKSYLFKVVFEQDKWPDEPDDKAIWRAYIPALPAAHAWGDTQQEALEHLKNAVDLIIADLVEEGKPIPTEPSSHVQTRDEPWLVVTL
jgi:predicted RNase H-like HicB family nuclease